MTSERIAKYEAWLRAVEANQRELDVRRPSYIRLFGGVLALSPLAFFVNAWIGAAAVITGLLVFIFGYYTLAVRRRDYAREVAAAKRELARLRSTP